MQLQTQHLSQTLLQLFPEWHSLYRALQLPLLQESARTEHAARCTKAILVSLELNPHTFRPRLLSFGVADNNPNSNNSGEQAAQRSGLTGCNCKKSFCLKKYCECFHAAVYCSNQNVEGNEKREMLMAKYRHQEESARAAVVAAQQHSRLGNEGDETVTGLVWRKNQPRTTVVQLFVEFLRQLSYG